MPPIFCICVSCSRRSRRSNSPLRIFSAARIAFSASMLAAAFSTSATMSPMPRMRPAMRDGIEILQRVELFAGADQLDRLAGDGAHRQRRAAAAVAVDAGEHDAGEADALVERAREIDRVLAGQRIGDEQHFVRIGGALDLGRLRHHRFVERGAAGGVEHHHVVAAEPRRLRWRGWRSAPASGRRRSAACRPARRGRARRAAPSPPGGACRARPSAPCALPLGQALRDLGGGGGFAGALQADHHDGDRRRGVEIDASARRRRASSTSSSCTIFTTIWPGVTDLITSTPTALLLHLLDEVARHVERDVGLEQRAAHLAQRRVDVGFASARRAASGGRECRRAFRQVSNISSSDLP